MIRNVEQKQGIVSAMSKIRGLRWWMIGLIMLGSVINYLTRSTLSAAAPTLLEALTIGTEQYYWVVGTFQAAIMLQPLCGYVLDVIGLKRGYGLFAVAWSLISMGHGLAHNWQVLVQREVLLDHQLADAVGGDRLGRRSFGSRHYFRGAIDGPP